MLYNRYIEIRFPEKKAKAVPPRQSTYSEAEGIVVEGTTVDKLIRERVVGGRQRLVNGRVFHPPSISIDVSLSTESNPNNAKVTIYNLSSETQRELFVEGGPIEIWAGYWPENGSPEIGAVFKGQIRKASTKTEGGIEVVSEIECGDSDDAFGHARVRKVVGRASHAEITQAIVDAFKEYGVKPGRIDIPDYQEKRSRTIDRAARRELDDICRQHDLQWSIQDGVLNVYPRNEPLEANAKDIVLSPNTGVLDSPQFTETGIELKTLMLPSLRPGHVFRLENPAMPKLRAPESYKIEEITFAGDNFGGDFGCTIKAKQLGDTNKDKKVTVSAKAKVKRMVKRSRQRLTGMKT